MTQHNQYPQPQPEDTPTGENVNADLLPLTPEQIEEFTTAIDGLLDLSEAPDQEALAEFARQGYEVRAAHFTLDYRRTIDIMRGPLGNTLTQEQVTLHGDMQRRTHLQIYEIVQGSPHFVEHEIEETQTWRVMDEWIPTDSKELQEARAAREAGARALRESGATPPPSFNQARFAEAMGIIGEIQMLYQPASAPQPEE